MLIHDHAAFITRAAGGGRHIAEKSDFHANALFGGGVCRLFWLSRGIMVHHRDDLKLNSEHAHTTRDESGRLSVLAVATQVLEMRCGVAGVSPKNTHGAMVHHTERQTLTLSLLSPPDTVVSVSLQKRGERGRGNGQG